MTAGELEVWVQDLELDMSQRVITDEQKLGKEEKEDEEEDEKEQAGLLC